VSKVEEIEGQVRNLAPAELRTFRDWFAQFDAEVWDLQIEGDAQSGKLDKLAERALLDHQTGRSKDL
jgi:hypothetical protein